MLAAAPQTDSLFDSPEAALDDPLETTLADLLG
jgi:hypothetical protein